MGDCFCCCSAAALLLARPLAAQELPLAWDASASPGVTNYILYAGTNSITATNLSSYTMRISVGTNLTARVESLAPGQWFFAATAQAGGIESAPSNILAVEVPPAPQRMRTMVVQYSGTLTNFYDVGFFRLKLP